MFFRKSKVLAKVCETTVYFQNGEDMWNLWEKVSKKNKLWKGAFKRAKFIADEFESLKGCYPMRKYVNGIYNAYDEITLCIVAIILLYTWHYGSGFFKCIYNDREFPVVDIRHSLTEIEWKQIQ